MESGIHTGSPPGATLPCTRQGRTATPRPPAIRAQGLVKTYPGARAVRGVDLLVRPGEVFALLGPDGAGKSTTLAMLCALIRPTDGSLWVAGHEARSHPAAVRRSVGVVFQDTTLDDRLTVQEHLHLHAALHGLPRRLIRRRITRMLSMAGLLDRRREPVRALCTATRRRLELTRALLHLPQVLLLDEPTTGLDPRDRADMWSCLHRMRVECGATVLLATRRLSETEHCDRLAALDRGRVTDTGTPAELRSRLGADLPHLVPPSRPSPEGACPRSDRAGGAPT